MYATSCLLCLYRPQKAIATLTGSLIHSPFFYGFAFASIVKKVCDFSLPLPGENTMVSIRIDTGYEKVDTDYVPLEDIDMIINQEFCL
jgi:hypothetical protein